jgi:hypothetical protein
LAAALSKALGQAFAKYSAHTAFPNIVPAVPGPTKQYLMAGRGRYDKRVKKLEKCCHRQFSANKNAVFVTAFF